MAPGNDDHGSAEEEVGGSATASAIPATEMIYNTYEGNFQLECEATVLSCHFIDDGGDGEGGEEEEERPRTKRRQRLVRLCLDRTVLHAQGGGQPTDTGRIHVVTESGRGGPPPSAVAGAAAETTTTTIIDVTNVLLDRTTGVATHTGQLTMVGTDGDEGGDDDKGGSLLSVGQAVRVEVDADNRRILSECHTAGHVVDSAMAGCDSVMPATKAYHFLDGPYVEYRGNVPTDQRAGLLARLQASFQELVDADMPTEIRYDLDRTRAEELCNAVAGEGYFRLGDQFEDENETVRIVTVAGWPCPCGGTHVKSTGDLKQRRWGITGFRCKKGVVRVKYGQHWDGN